MLFLLSGFPVAFALAANGLVFGLIGIGIGHHACFVLTSIAWTRFEHHVKMTLCLRFPSLPSWAYYSNDRAWPKICKNTIVVNYRLAARRCRLCGDFRLERCWLRQRRGRLPVISMGLISLPIMLKMLATTKTAAGVIAASGTLAQIIPRHWSLDYHG